MKHSITYNHPTGYDVKLTALKADEFLKEYWGQEVFFISMDGKTQQNSAVFSPEAMLMDNRYHFFAFRSKQDFSHLQDHDFSLTPYKSEVFEVKVSKQCVELSFYNSFTSNEREHHFVRVAELFKATIDADFPLIRIQQDSLRKTLMYKYRRAEGRVGFSFTPYTVDIEDGTEYLWIYTSDFEYLRPFIGDVDDTSDTDIPKNEWHTIIKQLRLCNADDTKQRAFFDYFISWIERQLSWASTIEIYGNL